jgi:uncharacterized damage-inducible protein DinB
MEAWQAGPVEGVPGLLQPVAHALLNCVDDLERSLAGLTTDQLSERPRDAASIDYHIRHAIGSLDRLFTYAREEALSDSQRDYLDSEKKSSGKEAGELLANFRIAVDNAITQLRSTNETTLTEPRTIGRAKLPSTVIGLLFHGAEHTARHTGQVVTTAKVVRDD